MNPKHPAVALALALLLALGQGNGDVRGSAAQPATSDAAPPRPAVVQDLPSSRGDPAQAGAHPGPGPAGEPVTRWRVDLASRSFASPVVVDGIVFAAVSQDADGPLDRCVLHARDATTGAPRWEFSGGCGTPTVADGTVYLTGGEAGSLTDAVFAVDAATGAERWRFDAPDELALGLTVAGDVVYVGGALPPVVGATDTRTGVVFALDAATGDERWRARLGDEHESSVDKVDSTPAVVDGAVYVGIDHSGLYALDAATGAEQWHFRPGDGVHASPAVVAGTVYAPTLDGGLFAVDTATGRERWRFDLGDASYASPAVVDGVVYAGGTAERQDDAFGSGTLFALDATTGHERWRIPGAADGLSSPVAAGGIVYSAASPEWAPGGRGDLHAVSAATGAELWRHDVGSVYGSPAVLAGTAYLLTLDGALLAIDGTDSRPTSSSPPATPATPVAQSSRLDG